MMSIRNIISRVVPAGFDDQVNHPGVRKIIFKVGNEFAEVMIITRAIDRKLDLFVREGWHISTLPTAGWPISRHLHFVLLFEVAHGVVSPGEKIAGSQVRLGV